MTHQLRPIRKRETQMPQVPQIPSLKCPACAADLLAPDGPKSTSEVWEDLRQQGQSAREWALQHGFEPTLVYSVLSGSRKCLRGKSHEVAKALGLK